MSFQLSLLALFDVPELTPLYNVYLHLVYAIKAAHVDTVIINGRIILRDREILTVDVDEVLDMSNRFRMQVLKKLVED